MVFYYHSPRTIKRLSFSLNIDSSLCFVVNADDFTKKLAL